MVAQIGGIIDEVRVSLEFMANLRMLAEKIEKRPFASECECRRIPGGSKRDHGQQEKPFFHRAYLLVLDDEKHRRVFPRFGRDFCVKHSKVVATDRMPEMEKVCFVLRPKVPFRVRAAATNRHSASSNRRN